MQYILSEDEYRAIVKKRIDAPVKELRNRLSHSMKTLASLSIIDTINPGAPRALLSEMDNAFAEFEKKVLNP